jgi:hypothetical protein
MRDPFQAHALWIRIDSAGDFREPSRIKNGRGYRSPCRFAKW